MRKIDGKHRRINRTEKFTVWNLSVETQSRWQQHEDKAGNQCPGDQLFTQCCQFSHSKKEWRHRKQDVHRQVDQHEFRYERKTRFARQVKGEIVAPQRREPVAGRIDRKKCNTDPHRPKSICFPYIG